MNLRQKAVVAVADLCILAEVFVSMYFAARHPDEVTFLFLKYFLVMVVPTLVAARIGVVFLRRPETSIPDSADAAAAGDHNRP